MIDEHGYRANVGIVLCNKAGQVLWARRQGQQDAWQFPQGGIDEGETLHQALYRELNEELGLNESDVEVIAESRYWIPYQIPKQFIRYHKQPLCIGQKQKWFLLRLTAPDSAIQLDLHNEPEFSEWRWVDPNHPAKHVIEFKREVYKQVLTEFSAWLIG